MSTDPSAAPVRKFLFDQSFDDATVVHRSSERKPVLMKAEQIDALRKEAFEAGQAAAQQAAADDQNARLVALIAQLDQHIAAAVAAVADQAAAQDVRLRQGALAIARKIMPEFAARYGLSEIDAVLTEAIRDQAHEPRLVVRIHENQFDAVNTRVQEIVTQRAYAGKVIVLADQEVLENDCRVEWADGGIERQAASTWQAVETTMFPTAN